MYQEVYTEYNEAGTIITSITPVNDNIAEKNREAKYMTTTTHKEKPGSKPLKPDKKLAPNTLSQEELKKRHDAIRAFGKERGYKEGRLNGAIIWFPEGPLF